MEVNALLNISDFPWAECAIVENRVMFQTDSLSLKRSKRNTGVMRYEFELVTIRMDMTQGRGIKAKLSAAVNDTIYFVHPRLSFTQGFEPPSGIQASGVNPIGSTDVNLTSIESWQLMAGDYLQFSNDTKVYEVAEDTLFQSTLQTVTLTHPIRLALTDTSTVTVNGVAWHLISNGVINTEMQAIENQDIELTLVAVEKL